MYTLHCYFTVCKHSNFSDHKWETVISKMLAPMKEDENLKTALQLVTLREVEK